MRNLWVWLVDRLWPKAGEASDAAAHRIVCATPHAWAAEERQTADWALADQAQSYDGKCYSGDDVRDEVNAIMKDDRKQ